MGIVSRFVNLPFQRKVLLLESVILTAVARFAVLTLPFRWISKLFGRQMGVTPEAPSDSNHVSVRDVGWAIEAVSRRVPWNANCLAQAIAATIMLRRRATNGTVYFGVTKNKEGRCQAHAWLRSGDVIVTGANGMNKFTVVSTFAFVPNAGAYAGADADGSLQSLS